MDTNNLLLNLVRKIEPTLTGTGMYSDEKYENDPIPLNEFVICLEWLQEQSIGNKINTMRTSYALKSYVEEWTRKVKGQFKYISNGAMIAAIIALGIKYSKIDDDLNIFAAVYNKEVEND